MLCACHADQPANDWTALMGLIFGKTGYAKDAGPLLVTTSVGSFYDRMMPDQSVSLATCFGASHWFKDPFRANAPESVWFADLKADTFAKMSEQAQKDWTRFLRLRAAELHSGGFLFVSTLGSMPCPGETNGIAASGRGVYRALQSVTAGMAEDGLLDRHTADTFIFGFWFMTEDEARHPLEAHDDLKRAFEIETIKTTPLDDGGDMFLKLRDTPDEYAKRYVGFVHAFASLTLRSQLFGPSAIAERTVDDLETEFFRRLEDLYRQNTAQFEFAQFHIRVILRRR